MKKNKIFHSIKLKTDCQLNNIFDQYDLPENRLTNAFLQTLSKNTKLLQEFLNTAFNISCMRGDSVVISSQKKPFGLGDIKEDTEQAEGIPDGWIVINENKAIVFETKIGRNPVKKEQLLRHSKRIKGYEDKYLCVITPHDESPIQDSEINGAKVRWFSWREIYEIVNNHKTVDSELSEFMQIQLKEYLVMQENLVGFQGIDYKPEGFTIQKAKIIIKNLTKEIHPEVKEIYPGLKYDSVKYSQKTVHPYTVYPGHVWSFLATDKNFTKDVHFSFWLAETHMAIGVTVPNSALKRWTRLRSIFRDEETFNIFTNKLFILRKTLPNLYLQFVHRHFLGQKDGIIDGMIEIDLDTIKGKKPVKSNPLWINVMRQLVNNKRRYNGQFMIITRFFYKDHPDMKSFHFKDRIIKVVGYFEDVYNYLVSELKT